MHPSSFSSGATRISYYNSNLVFGCALVNEKNDLTRCNLSLGYYNFVSRISESYHSYNRYPLSCVGWCFMMSKDVAVDFYYMSLDTPLLHLEDVAFTGIIREKIGDIKVNS